MRGRVVVAALAALLAWPAEAQQAGVYDLSWTTVDQGGGRASGGVFSIDGTIAQPDAAPPIAGGAYAASGGYWAGVQTGPSASLLFKDGFE
jgi:hypothetical protein